MSRTVAVPQTTHLAMSSDIATAGTCGWKYRLSKIFGIPPRGSFSGLVGFAVHDILTRSGGVIYKVWQTRSPKEYTARLREGILPLKQQVFEEWKDRFQEGAHTIDELFSLADKRLDAMLLGLAELMSEFDPPLRFLTELSITNPETHHEGRLDALAEWDDQYLTIDYKTYDDDAPRSHSYDHFQIVANGMLANYRNRMPESDFSRNKLVI